jgi:ribosomal protein S18 acetylase RimI-like enzyme
MHPHIRPMRMTDLTAIQKVQSQCYPAAYLESREAFATKLAGAPGSCWVAQDREAAVQAYLVCLPVDEESFPALNASLWNPPIRSTMLYLHDLAVSPSLRGSGTATSLVAQARTQAQHMGLQSLVLVAVQGSEPFWQRHGFAMQTPEHVSVVRKLASFGTDAHLMTCPV